MTAHILAQATTPTADATGTLVVGGLVVLGTLLWALVPVFISAARHRSTLVFWCWVFTLLAIVIMCGGFFMSSQMGAIAGMFGVYAAAGVANLFWLMGLICGVGAAVDKMAERRLQKQMRAPGADYSTPQNTSRGQLPMAPRPHRVGQ